MIAGRKYVNMLLEEDCATNVSGGCLDDKDHSTSPSENHDNSPGGVVLCCSPSSTWGMPHQIDLDRD
jgi:hypothetical protein